MQRCEMFLGIKIGLQLAKGSSLWKNALVSCWDRRCEPKCSATVSNCCVEGNERKLGFVPRKTGKEGSAAWVTWQGSDLLGQEAKRAQELCCQPAPGSKAPCSTQSAGTPC